MKKNIRDKMRAQRRALSQQYIQQKAELARAPLTELLKHYQPTYVASYKPMENEFDVTICDQTLSAFGCQILYPRIDRDRGELDFHLGENFTKSAYGFLEPSPRAPKHQPDIIICPFVAVDKNKRRLGYGGGYYDRICAKYPQIITIAIGYQFQSIEDFGAEKHDLIFDHILLF
ncbi:MAG: 5-formyltetrahydrofolate cyclo-ligase [Pseudomonadota bacterium]